ncbi:hypothetical protein QAD02_011071 [Eretmocerus hayati]|uniref:Uncharacterized protein n=1 Tax=Eretmocerus hayati TaxID=131215 RepID=A0ACC2P0H4_9HYME|nr:hypothetical protein QAD02_011071 [Eretmocerus hayati]
MESTKKEKSRSEYRRQDAELMVAGPPLDFSFRNATSIKDLVDVSARSYRVGKMPEKPLSTGLYLTSSIWLSNNSLENLSHLEELVTELVGGTRDVRWLDLAYNILSDVDDELLKFKKLTILYLHGNRISDMNSLVKLRKLTHLRTLTLHGNPLEQMPAYRRYVVAILPQITNLDFSPVLEIERRRALPTGFFKTIRVDS